MDVKEVGYTMPKQEGPGHCITIDGQEEIALPEIVSRDEWQAARDELLTEEKAVMKARDSLAAKRRRLPMTPVWSDYRFVGPDGELDLLGLFAAAASAHRLPLLLRAGRRELAEWVLLRHCAFFADTVVHPAHLAARDTSLLFVLAAPQERITTLKARIVGWEMPFYTLVGDEFSRRSSVSTRCSG